MDIEYICRRLSVLLSIPHHERTSSEQSKLRAFALICRAYLADQPARRQIVNLAHIAHLHQEEVL